jgi:hypothetical protein
VPPSLPAAPPPTFICIPLSPLPSPRPDYYLRRAWAPGPDQVLWVVDVTPVKLWDHDVCVTTINHYVCIGTFICCTHAKVSIHGSFSQPTMLLEFRPTMLLEFVALLVSDRVVGGSLCSHCVCFRASLGPIASVHTQ